MSVKEKPQSSVVQLENMSNEELINRVVQLETHNLQLKNILKKAAQKNVEPVNKSKKRSFDFSKSYRRHVMLKLLYFGWDYKGFASQEDTDLTIEHHLFCALKKTCLIASRETSNYHRCGRTDKEVSAFSQVISIDLRSKFPQEEQMLAENIANEIDYCSILNRVLPADIKCISWMPLRSEIYSARFDCIRRTYRYFFPEGNLNIEEMKRACQLLVGTHDFRNLCKMDVGNGVTNFVRTIFSAEINKCQFQSEGNKGYEIYYLEVAGQSFLWHQIRCIMSVLFLIGLGHESFTVVAELLDINKNSCKPQYSLAHGLPLNLYSCEFRSKTIQAKKDDACLSQEEEEFSDTTEWIFNEANLARLIENLQSEWSFLSIKSTMMREVLNDLEQIYNSRFKSNTFRNQASCLQLGVIQKQYKKLMTRKRCESLENRIAHYEKKRRIPAVSINNEEKSE